MKTSQKGIDLIKKFEGCKLYAYRDSVGVWTIGWGNTSHAKAGMAITQAQADKFLAEDLAAVESVLNKMNINFKQNQFDALAAWIFNLGEGKFKGSTLYKKIVARATDLEITDQIVRWINAGGKPSLGLKRRRVAEANMFLGRDEYRIDAQGNINKK